jgi:hypothetical protein
VKKLIFAHLFLNLFLLALLRPAFPIIEYFANYNFIVSELCENNDKPILTCNGKCYLEKQVKENNNLVDHQNHPAKLLKIDVDSFPTFVVFQTLVKNLASLSLLLRNNYSDPYENIQDVILGIFRPPQ